MAMREDKAELRARVFLLEKERATIELKLNARDTQITAQHATIQHLQGQLNDAEAMLAMATNKVKIKYKIKSNYSSFRALIKSKSRTEV